MKPLDEMIEVVRLRDRSDTSVSDAAFLTLRELLAEHRIRDEKDGAGFVPADFRAGGSRVDADVLHVNALVMDFDFGKRVDSEPTAREVILAAGKRWGVIVATSHNHQALGPSDWRFRLIIPTSRPMLPHEHRRVWEHVQRELGGHADATCRNPSRFYYLPSCPAERRNAASLFDCEGPALDVDAVLAEAEPEPERPRYEGNGTRPATGYEDVRDASEAYVRDHPVDYPRRGSQCPACPSPDGFKAHHRNADRWVCMSSQHEGVRCGSPTEGPNGSRFHIGSVLDLHALEAGQDVFSFLKERGYLLDRARARRPNTPAADSTEASERGESFNTTDLGNCERLVSWYGEDFRYSSEMGSFIVWDGARFKTDLTGTVDRLAKETARRIASEAEGASGKARTELLHHAAKAESVARLQAMVTLARSEPGVALELSELDRDPWALNVRNGTLDLRHGTLRPHRRADLITKLAPVDFDPDATCPRWERFIAEIMDGDEEMVGYLQRVLGYFLTGSTREQKFWMAWGPKGRNGKGVLSETLGEMMGDYARAADFESFMQRRGATDRPRNDLAALRGARLVFAAEANRGHRLDEALVKKLTGGDTLTVRFLYGEDFTYKPAFKLLLSVNHRPEVQGTDPALWARVQVVKFPVTFEGREDRDLIHVLRTEHSGILTWCVKGCLSWQQIGLCPPAKVLAETRRYRSDMDAVGSFLAAECTIDPGPTTEPRAKASELHARYVSWCEANAEEPMSQKKFGLCLGERDLDRKRIGGVFWWRGVRLLTDRERADRDRAQEQEEIADVGT